MEAGFIPWLILGITRFDYTIGNELEPSCVSARYPCPLLLRGPPRERSATRAPVLRARLPAGPYDAPPPRPLCVAPGVVGACPRSHGDGGQRWPGALVLLFFCPAPETATAALVLGTGLDRLHGSGFGIGPRPRPSGPFRGRPPFRSGAADRTALRTGPASSSATVTRLRLDSTIPAAAPTASSHITL